jgi:hypothetical protein
MAGLHQHSRRRAESIIRAGHAETMVPVGVVTLRLATG